MASLSANFFLREIIKVEKQKCSELKKQTSYSIHTGFFMPMAFYLGRSLRARVVRKVMRMYNSKIL